MKKPFNLRITITLLPCYCWLSLIGQPYLNESSAWHEELHYSSFPYAIVESCTISLQGDTLINGFQYYKTWRSGTRTQTYTGHPTIVSMINESRSPIREAEKRFYSFNTTLNEERLLHDFNLKIGDTVDVEDHCNGNIITWADTVYIGTIPRVRYHFNGQYDIAQIIEGVGTSFGLFWSPCNFPIPSFLQCYTQDGAYLQLDPEVDCSALVKVTSVSASNPFIIYPNPFQNKFEVQLPSGFNVPLTITVFDMLGTTVYNTQIPFPASIESIDMSNTLPGLYIVCLQLAGSISSYKVVRL